MSYTVIVEPLHRPILRKHKQHQHDQTTWNLPDWRHFLAAGTAAAISAGLYNPLDCLRCRWQVQETTEKTITEFGYRILKQEGLLNGLWRPGLAANMTGMAFASALRFGYYETVRDGLSVEDKEGHHIMFAGLLCGATAYFVTTPFHLIKTQIQAQSGPGNLNDYIGRILRIVNEQEFEHPSWDHQR